MTPKTPCQRPSPCSGSLFGPAPTHPGLHIWRVEKLRPVPVPESSWGVFFSGDAYLVLHLGPEERAHLHLWIGEHGAMGATRGDAGVPLSCHSPLQVGRRRRMSGGRAPC